MSLIITMWVRLLSVGLLGGGVYLIRAWYTGVVAGIAYLVGGLSMLIFSIAGRPLLLLLRRRGADEPKAMRNGATQRLPRPDGTELHVEFYGPPDGPPIIMTHGWGMDSTAWYYAKRQLADQFRLIVWDLPGLGKSRKPANNDYTLEKLARDLEAVVALAGDKPAILVGHSIGGMITLTFCRLFPQHLGRRVAGLILAHTTYTDPMKTIKFNGFFRVIEKPLLIPLQYLTIWLAPIVWLMNWLSYYNGLLHLMHALIWFTGRETRGQLDFVTRLAARAWPAVLARGQLGTSQFDETATLATIDVPVLVISGDRDQVTLPEAGQRIYEAVVTAEQLILSPAGHMGVIEQHTQFNAAIGGFSVHARGAGMRAPSERISGMFANEHGLPKADARLEELTHPD